MSTRDFVLGDLPNESGSQINVTIDLLKHIAEDSTIDKNENFTKYFEEILPVYLHKIKYFPKSQQYLILRNLNIKNFLSDITANNILNNNSLIEELNENIGDHLTRYGAIKKALFEFVKQNERRTTVGLGCLIKVAENYGAKNLENYELLKSVKSNLKLIYEEHSKMLEKEFEFINDITNQLEKKKIEIYNENITKCIANNNYNECITYFKMTKLDLTSFKEFAKAKNNFNLVLHKNALLAQINIGIMIGCNGGINTDSGLSSYRGVGINENNETIDLRNGSRRDGLTQNGYNLSFGFGFGNSRFDNMEPVVDLLYYGEFKEYYILLRKIFNIMTKQYVFKDVASLGNIILNRINHVELKKDLFKEDIFSNMSLIISRFKDKEFANASLISELKDNNYITEYNTRMVYDNESVAYNYTTHCTLTGFRGPNCYLRISGNSSQESKFKIYDLIIGTYAFTNNKSNATSFQIIYEQGVNDLYSIELKIDNKSIEHNNETLSQTLNACFGVIYSGGKNDKDTCRNVFKETCGNELDYRCKESGLYDILTENPPSNNYLPEPCQNKLNDDNYNISNNNECQYWFYSYMLSGNIELKPSAIVGFSLLMQANYNNKKLCQNCRIEEFNKNNETNNLIYLNDNIDTIYKWYIPSATDLEDEAERSAYFLIENSKYIKVYSLLFLLISIIIF